jgi:hypothetical protein
MAVIVKKNWNELGIAMPDFKDKGGFLKTCGLVIVREMIAGIENETTPAGGPQKQNSPMYAALKEYTRGYTTPGKGMAPESPYLAKETTWKRDLVDDHTLRVHANTRRAAVVVKLAEMGYWFVGISVKAEKSIAKLLYQYLEGKIKKMAAGKAV